FNCLIFKELFIRHRLATAFIYYHVFNFLSTPFFKSFSDFLFCAGRSLTTLISYHFLPVSVNTFFQSFFRFFVSPEAQIQKNGLQTQSAARF
ncbi:MAG: hypothetical protein II218_09235, partial [Peptococcaceae bacterium]|nr:hypothetical protein [Peptococcaceae bacterium]